MPQEGIVPKCRASNYNGKGSCKPTCKHVLKYLRLYACIFCHMRLCVCASMSMYVCIYVYVCVHLFMSAWQPFSANFRAYLSEISSQDKIRNGHFARHRVNDGIIIHALMREMPDEICMRFLFPLNRCF